MTGHPIGIEIPEIFDGVAIWLHPDGTLENRFAHYLNDAPGSHWRRAAEAAQDYIDQQKGVCDA